MSRQIDCLDSSKVFFFFFIKYIINIQYVTIFYFSVYILLHSYAHNTRIMALPVGDKPPTFHSLIGKVRKRNMIDFGYPNGTMVGVSFQFDRRFLGNFVGETCPGNYIASAPNVDGLIGISYITEIGD